jgi:hypothetical protein
MLKITITNTVTEERWTLHGRLVAPWVNELKASWRREHRAAPGRRCIVNLDEVTFIDKSEFVAVIGARGIAWVHIPLQFERRPNKVCEP